MANVIATIGVYGDIHLRDKAYGAHTDYPTESLEYFTKITGVTEKRKLTHLIGLGDFSYGRFQDLRYRLKIEEELTKQYNLVKGNRYELKGNHDITSGMSERDFYIAKGLLKPSTNLEIGNLNITMVDYDKHNEVETNIIDDETHINFILAHDFFKFKDTAVANFGAAIELDNFEKWFGADYLVCGHVHKIMGFKGSIIKDNLAHELYVHYLGCMTRPSYREGYMDEKGQMLILTLYDDGQLEYDIEDIELWDIEKSFNLAEKEKQKQKKEEKAARVDISDIVKQLDSHKREVGNPEDIIKNMTDIDERYKSKAIELLHKALEN